MKITKIIGPSTYMLDGVKKANARRLVTVKKPPSETEIDIEFPSTPKLPTAPPILRTPPALPRRTGRRRNQPNRFSPS